MRITALLLATALLPGILVAADTGGDDTVAAAATRHAWRWFGLDEAAALERAASASRAMVVMVRDGEVVDPPPAAGPQDVRVAIAQGRIISARIDSEPGDAEGTLDVTLIPWLARPEAEIQAEAAAAERPFRVISRDGESFPMTMDWREDRVNAVVVGGVVVALSGG